MENDTEKISSTAVCIVCGGDNHSLYANKNGYTVLKCRGCGTLFLHPLPKFEESAAVYSADYFGGATHGHGYVDYDIDKEAMRSVFNYHLDHFEKILGKKGRLFDVGAATGFFMRIARDRGWQVNGIDISDYASRVGRAHGLDLATGIFEQVNFPVNTFDLVTMWDLIEHVPNPEAELKKAASILKSGGLLAINTPDSGSFYSKLMGSKWHLFVPPEHIWYFNRNSIKILLNKAGFEVLEIGCIGKKFTLEYVISFLYRWQKLSFWDKLAKRLQHSKLGKLSLPINLRDNMYVLARKK